MEVDDAQSVVTMAHVRVATEQGHTTTVFPKKLATGVMDLGSAMFAEEMEGVRRVEEEGGIELSAQRRTSRAWQLCRALKFL